jgi:hypothetical protein
MLHMATESEMIWKIHYQVDNCDEQQEFLQGSEELPKVEFNSQQHVKLCAPDKSSTTIAAYSIILYQRHGVTNVFESLSLFFKQNNLSADVDSYKVCLS